MAARLAEVVAEVVAAAVPVPVQTQWVPAPPPGRRLAPNVAFAAWAAACGTEGTATARGGYRYAGSSSPGRRPDCPPAASNPPFAGGGKPLESGDAR